MNLRTLICLLLLAAPGLMAQTAELTGRVTDPSGAVITGATVTATNENTKAARRTQTTDAGYFVLTQLPPGEYRLMVEASGFGGQTQTGIHLAVQQTARIDVMLKLGSVAESVEVKANAALLETSNATVGYVIENKRVVDLPLKGRQFLEFALLGPRRQRRPPRRRARLPARHRHQRQRPLHQEQQLHARRGRQQ